LRPAKSSVADAPPASTLSVPVLVTVALVVPRNGRPARSIVSPCAKPEIVAEKKSIVAPLKAISVPPDSLVFTAIVPGLATSIWSEPTKRAMPRFLPEGFSCYTACGRERN
jgi:hypothetical protein